MATTVQLPYLAEYAKSGRAACKGCKNPIPKDELRIAKMKQSPFHDGMDAHWHHKNCFLKKFPDAKVPEIQRIELLKWSDQTELAEKLSSGQPVQGSSGNGSTGGKKGVKRKSSMSKTHISRDFGVEHAKSGKSGCVACEAKIEKDAIRIWKMDDESESAARAGGSIPRYHHLDCFAYVCIDIGFAPEDLKHIKGFKSLSKEEKALISSKIMSALKTAPQKNGNSSLCKSDEPLSKKIKVENDEAVASSSKSPLSSPLLTSVAGGNEMEGKIKKENEDIFKLRGLLNKKYTDKVLSLNDFKHLLQFNKQQVPNPGGLENLLKALVDVMYFGALAPCTSCMGQIRYRSGGIGYQCQGNISEFTKCLILYPKPKRVPFKVPAELEEKLRPYRFKTVKDRIIYMQPPPDIINKKSFVKISHTPLKGFNFVLSPNYNKGEEKELKEKIKAFAGAVKKVNKKKIELDGIAAIVVKNEDELDVKEKSELMKMAQEKDVAVIKESFFLEELNKIDLLIEFFLNSIVSSWTNLDPHTALKYLKEVNPTFSSPSDRLREIEEEEKKVRMVVKGGCVVDSDSNLAHKTHVYKEGKLIYSVVMSKTDLDTNVNSFYKLQLLESDKSKKYYVFRSWGRIGTTIGKNQVDPQPDLYEAITLFKFLYKDKTGNDFGKSFKKKAGLYMVMDIDYGDAGNEVNSLKVSKTSKLDLKVQELLCLIFDIEKMKETLMEFELDIKKMPLGKISKSQIMEAFTILKHLMTRLEDEKESKNVTERHLVDDSNRFFTLIPHSFGIGKLPILNSKELVKSRLDMLEQLMEIELAYELLVEGDVKDDEEGGKPTIDRQYALLNAKIETIETHSDDFNLIQKYLTNTHAATHSSYSLQILQIYKVARAVEEGNMMKHDKTRMLLWHGSRTTNFAGILSQGLRIAPPEAPVTGYMFGKGIYFADMVSKSANYCNTTPSRNIALILLCEVEVGKMHELVRSKDTLLKAPKGFDSVKGCGMTVPDPKEATETPDGLIVPCGKPISAKITSDLLYNEYIVYDTKQVKIRYVLQVKFDYTRKRH